VGPTGARTAVPADPAVADTTAPVTGRPAQGRPEPGPLARCVGDPDAFAAEHWGRTPLLTRNGAGFRDLLDLDGIDDLLSRRGLRTPFIRMAKAGQVLDSSSFTAPGGVGAEIGDQVRDDKVAVLFGEGATVVLQALHRTWPPVIDFCTRLAAELGHPVQANSYVTPPSSRGFSAHYDVHDVFVLQLAGRKHWTIHAPVLADPLRDQGWGQRSAAVAAAAEQPPVIDAVLEPGDALYLPRGWLHAATALGEVSAHLTVGIHVVSRFALVEALTALVADDPALRATLPLGIDVADPAALAPHLESVRAALVDALGRVSDDAVARRVRRRVWSGGRPEPVGVVAGTAFAAGLAPGDVVRLRVGLHHRLRHAGEQVVLELADREVALPAFTEEAVRALLGGDAVAVGSLPKMEEADQIVLVRRLLREGVVVPAGRP
jgi:bifunctional lysine-specific demethylase and histidyl-hydroxylase NO66